MFFSLLYLITDKVICRDQFEMIRRLDENDPINITIGDAIKALWSDPGEKRSVCASVWVCVFISLTLSYLSLSVSLYPPVCVSVCRYLCVCVCVDVCIFYVYLSKFCLSVSYVSFVSLLAMSLFLSSSCDVMCVVCDVQYMD
jgi:hypothetical protein